MTGAGATDTDAIVDVIARLRRELRRRARAAMPRTTMSVAQFEVLQFIAEHGGCTSTEVGRQLRLAPTTASTLLGQLLDRDLIWRRPDDTDRRSHRLRISTQGRRRLRAWTTANGESLSHAIATLSGADQRRLREALPALQRLVTALAGAS